MRYTHVVTVIAWAFLALSTSVATAQEAPAPYPGDGVAHQTWDVVPV